MTIQFVEVEISDNSEWLKKWQHYEVKKIATEKSGSIRNQAIYFQLYEGFISKMNLLICDCIKQDKSNKQFLI